METIFNLVVCVTFGICISILAVRQGRSRARWLIFGTFFSIIALPIIVYLQTKAKA